MTGNTKAWLGRFGELAKQTEVDSLKTSVSNGKSAVASAITDKGISTSATASFNTMANNIRSIPQLDTSDATATAADIASGKTAYVNGMLIVGIGQITIPDVVGSCTFNLAPIGRNGSTVLATYSSDGAFTKCKVDVSSGVTQVKYYNPYQSIYSYYDNNGNGLVTGMNFVLTKGSSNTTTYYNTYFDSYQQASIIVSFDGSTITVTEQNTSQVNYSLQTDTITLSLTFTNN